jgi:hypothetical protein
MKIRRTAAILITVAVTMSCGFPGLAMMCLGNLTILTTQEAGIPSTIAISDLVMSAIYLLTGLMLFLIPVVVGAVTLSLSDSPDRMPTKSEVL